MRDKSRLKKSGPIFLPDVDAILDGSATEKIAECADAFDVDLVVLGAHGYGPVEKHFVGKTTDKLLAKLSKPLLTVKI